MFLRMYIVLFKNCVFCVLKKNKNKNKNARQCIALEIFRVADNRRQLRVFIVFPSTAKNLYYITSLLVH